jgi:glycosyltransferase involved in cell wall biosynthesis
VQQRKSPGGNFRLIIILNRFVVGGPVLDTVPLAWYLRNEFDILILYGEKGSREIEADFLLSRYPGIKMKKIRHLKKTINPVNDVLAFISVLLTIKSTKAHIVHTHGAKPGLIGRLAAYVAGVPVIVHTFHGHFFQFYFSKVISMLMVRLERLLARITTCSIALSKTQRLELVEKYRIQPIRKTRIIPLGFTFTPTNDTRQSRNAFREKYGLKPEDVAVGIVGRIAPVKNHPFFVEVIKKLLSTPTRERVAFCIVGDGEEKEALFQVLYNKDIQFNTKAITESNRVIFTSWITELEKVMNGLDIIVLTSYSEGTPLSLIEAQYFKKPVVATNVGGVKDIIINGVTGFVCENDVTTFAEKLRVLIASEELRNQMGEEGYVHVSAEFSKEKEISATKELYYTLLRQKGYSLK